MCDFKTDLSLVAPISIGGHVTLFPGLMLLVPPALYRSIGAIAVVTRRSPSLSPLFPTLTHVEGGNRWWR